jgi:proteic killer suppression protein
LDIVFKTSKLRKQCNSFNKARRSFGDSGAKKLMQRLAEIRAAENLQQLMRLPAPRCHPLTGDLGGLFSVDLDHPYRLLFEPAHEPLPVDEDGSLDYSRVTRVRIWERKDTHG